MQEINRPVLNNKFGVWIAVLLIGIYAGGVFKLSTTPLLVGLLVTYIFM